MTTGLEAYLQAHTRLSDTETEKIMTKAQHRSLRRNEMLLQEGQVCRHKTFVVKGLLRIFGTADDGSEHILQFSPEHTWTLEAESYDRGTPAAFSIAAVEPSELMLWTKPDFDSLLTEIPGLLAFSQQLVLRSGHSNRHRLFAALSATPEEKYAEFIHSFPDLMSRLPLHMIAAYLGISLKTLTRIRHAQWQR
ncbi:Crp/Fnr family transcriptional regulator [Taibaiella koreensis]|uniref:Crp/Fnr family transcriptional regulator n=1 Tax=Taibaiella koreensis TaxID=1268548 RepID=UPI000E5A015D|nr:Crp/Fnr family transcriptional regulator [Taibaiella koreensis]